MEQRARILDGNDSISEEWQRCFGWIEGELGGKIVRAERQLRWRPDWFLDLERGSETLPLYFRGDRAEADQGVYALEPEMKVMQVLEQHAAQLGMEEGALNTALHRLRKHFRAALHAEVADTVTDPADVEDELRFLRDVLARARR